MATNWKTAMLLSVSLPIANRTKQAKKHVLPNAATKKRLCRCQRYCLLLLPESLDDRILAPSGTVSFPNSEASAFERLALLLFTSACAITSEALALEENACNDVAAAGKSAGSCDACSSITAALSDDSSSALTIIKASKATTLFIKNY
eukprot:CAMPEP_0169178172 /NCGR_PEP_ID=MMETSP1015-20121227/66920_1 /TAXON_ID=342587 /ORGANISM="Karlodinium micrum, Strain CCMP2283" /LENGTH=147 /DNA_ID=CAMNT_0009253045 /DNA_START=129 /DNA_END=572 /DNA_ORIENTATION=-